VLPLGLTPSFFVANPGQGADVAAFQIVLANHGTLGLVDLRLCEGDVHAQNLGAVEQALGVLGQAEDGGAFRGFVGTHALKSAAAVVQGVAQHMDRGIAPIDHLAVHPDFAVTV